MQQTEGETIIYSGRDDDNHKEGVGILMSRSASRTLMDWTPISERIIQARFYSQHAKLTIVHTSLTEEADEQVKEEFYVVLHDVIDNRNKKDLLIITGDINAKVGEENLDYDKLSGRSREGAGGARPPIRPLIFTPNWGPKGRKNCF